MASIAKQAPSAPTVGSCHSCMQWNLQEKEMGLYSCLLWVTVFSLHCCYNRYPCPCRPLGNISKASASGHRTPEILLTPRTTWKWVNAISLIYPKLLWETKAKNPTISSVIDTKINDPGEHESTWLGSTLENRGFLPQFLAFLRTPGAPQWGIKMDSEAR